MLRHYDATVCSSRRGGPGHWLPPYSPDQLHTLTRVMSSIGKSWQALHRWVIDNGHIHAGPSGKLYVRAGPTTQADWASELQQSVTRC
jgi:hypothetical protein